MKFIKSIITIALTILLIFYCLPTLAASSGTYISARIGDESASNFSTFTVIEQSKPQGTNITYQFASSKDNYNFWSDAQSTDSTIDLSKIATLSGSKYIKVKINMSSDNSNAPSIKGFEVTYDIASESQSDSSSSGSASSDSSSGTSTSGTSSSSSSSSSADNSTANVQVKTEKVTLSQNQNKKSLVSVGANLWVNIGVALVLSGLISFFIFRKKYNNTVDKV